MAHTLDIPRGHGTTPMIVDLIVDDPDTIRRYGRTVIRRWCSQCPWCRAVDARAARLHRIRAAYGRRRS